MGSDYDVGAYIDQTDSDYEIGADAVETRELHVTTEMVDEIKIDHNGTTYRVLENDGTLCLAPVKSDD